MKLLCIGDEDTVAGFRMAGIAGHVATNPEEAWMVIEDAAACPDYGVILITEALADGVMDRIQTIRLEKERPLIVEIPGPEGPLPGRRGPRELVQEALGMRI